MAASFELRPADGAGSDYDDPTISAAVSAEARRVRIRRDDRFSEWMLVFLRRGERRWLASPRQRKARGHSGQVARGEIGLAHALHGGFEDRGEALPHAEAKISGAGAPLAELCSRNCTQAGTAAGAAAIDAEQQAVWGHRQTPFSEPIQAINAQERIWIAGVVVETAVLFLRND